MIDIHYTTVALQYLRGHDTVKVVSNAGEFAVDNLVMWLNLLQFMLLGFLKGFMRELH